MTTVAYDGKTLAADSRATYQGDNHTCVNCAHEGPARKEDATKLTLMTGMVKFRDEKVLAVGQAGSQVLSRDLIKVLQSGEDLEQTYKHFRMFGARAVANKSSLIIVTVKSVYVVKAEEKMDVKKYTRNELVSIGSGKVGALMSMNMMGRTAAAAVTDVKQFDEATGGPVFVVDLTKSELKIDRYTGPETDVAAKPVRRKPATVKANARRAAPQG
jgi:hypothetical protein